MGDEPNKPATSWRISATTALAWVLTILLIAGSVLSTALLQQQGIEVPDPSIWLYQVSRFALFTIGVLALMSLARKAAKPPAHTKTPPADVPELHERIGASIESLGNSIGGPSDPFKGKTSVALDFARQLLSPEEQRARVVERIDLDGEEVTRTCVIHFDHEHRATTSSPFLPLLRFKKGYLVNGLEMTDQDGCPLSSLAHDDYVSLIACCLDSLLAPLLSSKKTAVKQDVRNYFLGICVINTPIPAGEFQARVDKHFAYLQGKIHAGSEDRDSLRVVSSLLAIADSAYTIVIPDDKERRVSNVTISYRQALPQRRTRRDRVLADWRAKQGGPRFLRRFLLAAETEARALLGVNPSFLQVDAGRAKKCDSYHLEVNAAPGYYVKRIDFYDERANTVRVPKESYRKLYSRSESYFRCPNPRGRTLAHFYARRFYLDRVQSPWVSLEFAERPIGSLGRAFVFCLSVLLVVWILGIPPLVKSSTNGGIFGAIDPGALLFTVPIALLAIVGIADRGPRSTSLLSQVSMIASSLVAIFALLLVQLIGAGKIDPNQKWPSVVMVTHPWWVTLLLISLAHLLILGYVTLRRFWAWRQSLGEPDEATQSH